MDGQGRPDPRRTWSPRFSVGQRAPGRVRSQAIAQTHQGPQNLGERRALELLQENQHGEWIPRQQRLRISQSVLIIAPGREGSQLAAQTHQGPLGCLEPAGLGTATATGVATEAAVSGENRTLRLSRPLVRGVNWAGADAYLGARLFCKIGVCYSSRTRLEIEQ